MNALTIEAVANYLRENGVTDEEEIEASTELLDFSTSEDVTKVCQNFFNEELPAQANILAMMTQGALKAFLRTGNPEVFTKLVKGTVAVYVATSIMAEEEDLTESLHDLMNLFR